ncbi:hypothetical protein [Paraclostridium bifermentans]|uniref:hypothetical protein n=1 Tax=Paraclostridium bifermentans TaxID=1490 RepID=UPI0011DE1FCF|nr:hypothetical protein [Paraclostridium bifermentans]
MSLVMGVGNKDFILFAGEQRCIGQDGHVVSESYKKVHKINDNVIIGFCGDSTYCEIITKYLFDDTLSKEVKLKATYEEIFSLIKSQFKSVVNQVEADTKYRKANAYIIIGGNVNGKLKLSALFYGDKLEINELDLNSINPTLIVLESGKCNHRSNITQKFENNPKMSIKNLTLIFASSVEEGVKVDNSINDRMNFELIKK